jgi:hypothetical protein
MCPAGQWQQNKPRRGERKVLAHLPFFSPMRLTTTNKKWRKPRGPRHCSHPIFRTSKLQRANRKLPHMSLEMNDLPRNNQAEGQAVKSKGHKPKGLRQFFTI